MSDYEEPTKRQIEFATTIAETVGDDLPEEYSKKAYGNFIHKNISEFYRITNSIRWDEVLGR